MTIRFHFLNVERVHDPLQNIHREFCMVCLSYLRSFFRFLQLRFYPKRFWSRNSFLNLPSGSYWATSCLKSASFSYFDRNNWGDIVKSLAQWGIGSKGASCSSTSGINSITVSTSCFQVVCIATESF